MPELTKRKVLRYSQDNELNVREEEIEVKNVDGKDKNRTAQLLSLVEELGLSISLPIVGGALVGSYLDRKLNSLPKITISLMVLGIVLGSINIYTVLKKIKD